jgi:ABC-type branched-subunit amino acid transport system ATPase component
VAHQEDVTILLVEQVIGQTLDYADHVYVMRSGESSPSTRLRKPWRARLVGGVLMCLPATNLDRGEP